MPKRIDLHIHINISDGALTPKEVIDEAVKNGMNLQGKTIKEILCNVNSNT